VTRPKNFGPFQRVPVIAKATCDRLGVGLAIPSKTLGKHRHALHVPLPFACQDGARPQVRSTAAKVHDTLSGLLWRFRVIKQAPALAIQVTQPIGLKPVGQNAKQEMTGQVRG